MGVAERSTVGAGRGAGRGALTPRRKRGGARRPGRCGCVAVGNQRAVRRTWSGFGSG